MRPLLLLALAACAPAPADRLPPPTQTLELSVGAVLPGQSITWSISGLTPGETTYLLWSRALANPGPCPPVAGGLCLDIAGPPQVLRRLVADASGVASWSATVPLHFPPGGVTTFQAVALRGVGATSSTKSPPVSRTTSTLPADQLLPGELVITEIMKDPDQVADAQGEWVEVTNLAGVDVDLFGLTLSDDGGERFTVPASHTLAAGGRVVFGASGDPQANGGVDVDVVWTGLSLDDAGDEVVLDADRGEIDRVAYDDGLTFADPTGASLSLSGDQTDALANDLGAAWCASPAGATPGAANPVCPDVCGDGVLDPGEACDDGGLDPGDGCDAACQIEACLTPISRGISTINGANSGYWGLDFVDAVILTDGDILWVGSVEAPGSLTDAAYVARIDGATRQPEWARLLSVNAHNFQPVGAAPAPDGEVWIIGNGDWDYGAEVSFTRLSSAGAVVSGSKLDAETCHGNVATHVAGTADGGFVVGGHWSDTCTEPDDTFAMLVSISPTGALRWQADADDSDRFTDQTVEGIYSPRNGNVIAWTKKDLLAGTDFTVIEAFTSTGGSLPDNKLNWDAPPSSATELWNGDILFAGRSAATGVGKLLALNTSTWTLRWTKHLSASGQTFSEPAPTVTPPLCVATPVDGQTCATPEARCPSATGRVCTCATGAWSCSTERATLDVGWYTGGPINAPLWTRHDDDGDLLRVRTIDRTYLRTPTGAYAARAEGGYREVTRGTSSSTIVLLDTDLDRAAACGETEPAGFSVSNGNGTLTPNGMLSPSNRFMVLPGGPAISPLPLPTFAELCNDEICP